MGLIGAHVSIAQGIELSVGRAKDLDLESFQIFTASQKQWLPGELKAKNADVFRKKIHESGLPFIVHAGYLPNLANPEEEPFMRSIGSLVQEMVRCSAIEAPFLVLHPGSHKSSGFDKGLERIVQGLGAIRDALSEAGYPHLGTTILFENTAGGPSAMGARFEHLARLVESSPVPAGVCLDTCHAHAAGYDLSKEGGMAKCLDQLDELVGLEKLRAIHLNDCRSDMGSGVDRHADILDGTMGEGPFRFLVNERSLKDTPMIMETPGGDDSYKRDLAYLRSLRV